MFVVSNFALFVGTEETEPTVMSGADCDFNLVMHMH